MESTTIAKPYANAIFAIAEENKSFDDWQKVLQAGAQLANDATLQGFMAAQGSSKQDKSNAVVGLLAAILGKALSAEETAFVHLLVKNQRINALPNIAKLFEVMNNANSDIQLFRVMSAYPLSAKQQQAISDDLSAKYKTTVRINVKIDEDLVGGVVIKQGDKVIDLSVQARVDALGLSLAVAH